MNKKIERKLRFVIVAVLSACVVISDVLPMGKVFAGVSDIVIDNTSFADTLSEAKWSVPNGDVTASGGKIVFPSNSTADTRIITNKTIKVNEYWDELFTADYTMKFTKMPSGKQFYIAFGLQTIESSHAEAGSAELTFENDGGLKASLIAYDDSGKKITLAPAKHIGTSLGQDVTIHVAATKNMELTVLVNGIQIYNKKSPIELSGRIGFLQSGSCAAEISKLNIISHQYDRPENTNIVEDFEKNTINVNTLTSFMDVGGGYMPSLLAVEEYNGNKVLMYRNVGMGYLGTMHQYSNFQISFDVPYMLHKNVYREDGTILQGKHQGFALSFGGDAADYDGSMYDAAADAIIFGSKTIKRLKGDKTTVDFTDKQYYDSNSNDGYSVKMTVIDQMVTVYMKALNAKNYDEILTYKIGDTTPVGHIHIWAYTCANFALDNLKITNLDKDANIVELDYKEGFLSDETGKNDYVYVPEEVVYRDGTKPSSSEDKLDAGNNTNDKENVIITDFIVQEAEAKKVSTELWIWLAITEIMVGLLISTLCFLKYRKKKRERGIVHEE